MAITRSVQVLLHLASTAEAHDALRQYEWVLMHMAMHDPVAGPAAGEVLELLGER